MPARPFLLIAALATGCASAPRPAAQPPDLVSTIHGRVHTGPPIPNPFADAIITRGGVKGSYEPPPPRRGLRSLVTATHRATGARFTARSDASGDFSFGPLPHGVYDLLIHHDGRTDAWHDVIVEPDKRTYVYVAFRPPAPTRSPWREPARGR